MNRHAFYASGWRLRALAASLRVGPAAPLRRLLTARALAPLSRPSMFPHAGESSEGALRTARDLTDAYRSGRATPRDVVERALDAADALDRYMPPLRAFVHLDARDVRIQADASTRRWREERPLGPLDGVPIAIKDEIDVAGQPTTCGTAFLGRSPACADALAVARLRSAGAIIFGKTHMVELGMGPSGINVHHGTARNPHDPERDSGGSSSGSAVAVAAGVVPIALGTDSGGSLRIPGALCGVAAFKGSFDRVPLQGVATLFPSMAHVGPLGASVADLATTFAILTHEPSCELTSVPTPLRIGMSALRWSETRADVVLATRAALDGLFTRGATEVPVDLPDPDLVMALGLVVLGGEAMTFAPRCALAPATTVTLDLARGITPSQRTLAHRTRARLTAELEKALEHVDVIIQPTTAITAPRYRRDALATGMIDEALTRELTATTLPACLAGLPAVQIPCGRGADGMPVGLHVVGGHDRDALVLRVAAEIERHAPTCRAAIWSDLLG